ncbi:MAG: hypothetical protein QXK88_04500 [Desulfurococcaceae archaeon]
MSAKDSRRKCVVCGRVFPQGQGIVLTIGDERLEFHSVRCFSKFTKRLLERMPPDEIKGYIRRVREEYEELLAQRAKLKLKKI